MIRMDRILRIFPLACLGCLLWLGTGCSGKGSRGAESDGGNQTRSEHSRVAGGGLPETSIYQFQGSWHTQENDTIQLQTLRGKIPVVAMVFTHCEFACPRIITDMKKIRKELPPDKADEVIFVLVSFDSERDHPARLKEYARQVKLDDKWLLLHGSEENVRMLSLLLDVNYQKQTGGTFAHSNVITLLNREGEIVTQVDGLGMDARPILSGISGM